MQNAENAVISTAAAAPPAKIPVLFLFAGLFFDRVEIFGDDVV